MNGDEPRDDTNPDSSDHADPSQWGNPAEGDQAVSPEHGEATPYSGYGSPGVHPIPPPPTAPPTPVGPADQVPPLADAPGVPPPEAYHGPAYPGETYPMHPPGQPPYPPGQPPYQSGQPVYPGYPGAVGPSARPGQVTAGVVMSWVGGGVFTLFGFLLLALAANKDLLDGVEQQLDRQIDRDQATTIFRTLGVGLGIWGIAIIVFAVFAWNGKNWARVVLTVMGALYCASQLVGVASGAVAGLLFLAYVVICVGLLWTRPAAAWFAASSYVGGPSRQPPVVW